MDARDARELNHTVAEMFEMYTGRNVAVDLTPNAATAGSDPLYASKVLAITGGHLWGLSPGKLAPDTYSMVPKNLPALSVPARNAYLKTTLEVEFEMRHPLFLQGQAWVDKYARRLGLDVKHPLVSPLHIGLHENTHTPAMREDAAHRFLPDALTTDRATAASAREFLHDRVTVARVGAADAEKAAELWRQLDRAEPSSAEYASAARELGQLPADLWKRDAALLTWHAHRELARMSEPHPLESDPRWADVNDERVRAQVSPYATHSKQEALGESGVDVSLFGHDASDVAKLYVEASPLDLDAFMNAADGLVATAQDFAGRVDPNSGRGRRSAPSSASKASRAPSSRGTGAETTADMSGRGQPGTAARTARTSLLASETDAARSQEARTADAKAPAMLRLLSETLGPAARSAPTPGRGAVAAGPLPPSHALRKETQSRLEQTG
ncbi:hypothetical protein ACIRL2_41775 [Embleya sp. NPDC127516]|uniref:hypothetical protein n=1 Tax=Embleya sp. NPDC127516 TaxID=3363990 RepID=UPI00380FF5E4